MQSVSKSFVRHLMKNQNKRIIQLKCINSIPHDIYENEFNFESGSIYEVLGVQSMKNTFILLDEWGEVDCISFNDRNFVVEKTASTATYPNNYIYGTGMNRNNDWTWFD